MAKNIIIIFLTCLTLAMPDISEARRYSRTASILSGIAAAAVTATLINAAAQPTVEQHIYVEQQTMPLQAVYTQPPIPVQPPEPITRVIYVEQRPVQYVRQPIVYVEQPVRYYPRYRSQPRQTVRRYNHSSYRPASVNHYRVTRAARSGLRKR